MLGLELAMSSYMREFPHQQVRPIILYVMSSLALLLMPIIITFRLAAAAYISTYLCMHTMANREFILLLLPLLLLKV